MNSDPKPSPLGNTFLEEIFLSSHRDISNIIERIRFVPKNGGIWFNDQPAILFRSRTFQLYRGALYDALGEAEARRLLMLLAFDAGTEDGSLALELRGNLEACEIITAGPVILSMQGFGTVGHEGMQADISEDDFIMDVSWEHSIEAHVQVQDRGIGTTPACSFNSGYASGFLSKVMNRPVIAREVECEAMGHSHCRFIAMYREKFESLEPEYEGLHDVPRSRQRRPAQTSTPAQAVRRKSGPSAVGALGDDMVGESAGFLAAVHMVSRVATTDATVLFLGESGVGKEGFARSLHQLSGRCEQPFVAVNCAAIPENLLESELFGVEKGAYTGASASREGRFEWANKGTLFLDEIATLSLPAQGKLLRVIQEGQLERLGAKQTVDVDVRIIAATNVDLREQVTLGEFRDDLFYRLNVFPIRLPPLRDRCEDIPLLMERFLAKFSSRHGKSTRGFSQAAKDALITYDWPGNIRELENLVERAVILVPDGEAIQVSHLFTSGEHVPSQIYKPDGAGNLAPPGGDKVGWDEIGELALDTSQPLETLERALITAALDRTEGNVSAAARILKMSRGQLAHRLRRLKS